MLDNQPNVCADITSPQHPFQIVHAKLNSSLFLLSNNSNPFNFIIDSGNYSDGKGIVPSYL
jgi:hypothetical protein